MQVIMNSTGWRNYYQWTRTFLIRRDSRTDSYISFICIGDVPYKATDGPFTICDYGTADGGASATFMKDCVGMFIFNSDGDISMA